MSKNELESKTEPSFEEEEVSFEEGFRRTVERLRPHFMMLWAAKKKFIYFNAVIAIVSVAILLLFVKNYYISSVTILPDYGAKETSLSQLSGLASLAGVSVGQGTPTDVYENLLISQAVLRPVIYAKYKTKEYPDSVNLIQYLKIKPDISLQADLQRRFMFLQAFKALSKGLMKVDQDKMTKILTVSVRMPEPELSAEVVNNAVRSLDDYVMTKRKSYATDQLAYISKRLGQIRDSLSEAEDTLMVFRERNRMVLQSPELMLEQGRLSRNVDLLDAVFVELKKQYELAKIDQIKDTPIVNVREYAGNPVVKTGPHRSVILIVIMLFAGALSGFYLGFRENIKKYIGYVRGR